MVKRPSLDLIVLDVNLPRTKGDEVLRQVRADPSLGNIPVIVMTSSEAPDDKATASWLGADLYIRKPSGLEELLEAAKVIEKGARHKNGIAGVMWGRLAACAAVDYRRISGKRRYSGRFTIGPQLTKLPHTIVPQSCVHGLHF